MQGNGGPVPEEDSGRGGRRATTTTTRSKPAGGCKTENEGGGRRERGEAMQSVCGVFTVLAKCFNSHSISGASLEIYDYCREQSQAGPHGWDADGYKQDGLSEGGGAGVEEGQEQPSRRRMNYRTGKKNSQEI